MNDVGSVVGLADMARTALEGGSSAILVTVSQALGSTPREAGAWMLVGADDVVGTIGGGRLEFDAIDRARDMLQSGESEAQTNVPLGPEIGQCCGGRVSLSFRLQNAADLGALQAKAERERIGQPAVFIFGAGHTGRALAKALAALPLAVTLVDSRPETLNALPHAIRCEAAAMPETWIETAPPSSGFVVMTHDHGLDFLITAAALAREDAAYVGMIGSATKKARFASYLRDLGRPSDIDRLTLPIGASALRDKRPEVIAALTASEVLTCLLSAQQKSLPLRLA
ncbi:xanthine dehydrogenase accessory protein XdhC [Fulvimarina manganoxydans]|uniref:xanthine dehydrogenase accessory protein XdhC n=1 Tax=Fulvimarina manganoxydans TaxID=937218 RepID=UPI00235421B4|nr:xanthine dehydrogenase accessory protein XdhC [Fulvimarina manganoxydans]